MGGTAEGGADQPARQLLQSRGTLLAGGAGGERGTGAVRGGDCSEGRVRSPGAEGPWDGGAGRGGKPAGVDSSGRACGIGAVVVCAAAVVVFVADGGWE